MAVTTASGTISTKLSQWMTSLSNSGTFQTATNAANAAAALAYSIHRGKVDPTIDGFERALIDLYKMRPYLIVWQTGGDQQKDTGQFSSTGTVEALLVWDVPREIRDNASEVDLQFHNLVGGIVDDLCAMGFTDGRLPLESIAWGQSKRFTKRRIVAQGDCMTNVLTAMWAG